MNVDVVVDQANRRMGFGCITRDAEGEFIVSRAIP